MTPEISSLTRSAIGCENESRTPGILPSSRCIAATSSGFGRGGGPLLPRLEHDQQVGLLGPHRVLGDLGAAGLADDRGHFGEALAQPALHEAADADGALERGVGQPYHVDRDRPLVQVRDELRARSSWRRTRRRRGRRPRARASPSAPGGRRRAATGSRGARARTTRNSFSGRLPQQPSPTTTGTMVSATTSETRIAMIIVDASGANIFPSIPCSEKSGIITITMISTENADGPRHLADRRRWRRAAAGPGRAARRSGGGRSRR